MRAWTWVGLLGLLGACSSTSVNPAEETGAAGGHGGSAGARGGSAGDGGSGGGTAGNGGAGAVGVGGASGGAGGASGGAGGASGGTGGATASGGTSGSQATGGTAGTGGQSTYGTEMDPAVDCKDLLANVPSAPSGMYWIDLGTVPAFDVYCEMQLAGGGWTRFWWYQANTGMNGVTDMLGDALPDCDPTGPACYATIPAPSADELLVTNGISDWMRWHFAGGANAMVGAREAFLNKTEFAPVGNDCGLNWNPADHSSGPFVCESGCDCFYYKDLGGIKSFMLDNDGFGKQSAFAAGETGNGGLGVDYRDQSGSGNSLALTLHVYWR